MKKWWAIWLLLIVMFITLLLGITRPGSATNAVVHHDFKTMSIGGSGARHDGWLLVGWVYGVAQFCLFTAILTLGLRSRSEGARGAAAAIVAIAGAIITVFSGVIWLYWQNSHAPIAELWFGFPPSTALMLFVLWPAPTLFVVLYVWKFDDWFLDPVSARRLLSQRGGDNELT